MRKLILALVLVGCVPTGWAVPTSPKVPEAPTAVPKVASWESIATYVRSVSTLQEFSVSDIPVQGYGLFTEVPTAAGGTQELALTVFRKKEDENGPYSIMLWHKVRTPASSKDNTPARETTITIVMTSQGSPLFTETLYQEVGAKGEVLHTEEGKLGKEDLAYITELDKAFWGSVMLSRSSPTK